MSIDEKIESGLSQQSRTSVSVDEAKLVLLLGVVSMAARVDVDDDVRQLARGVGLVRKNGCLTKQGEDFLCSMLYQSVSQSPAVRIIEKCAREQRQWLLSLAAVDSVITDEDIESGLAQYRWGCSVEQGRIMLVELMVKSNARSYNSHTEEGFLHSQRVTESDRKINQKGWLFLLSCLGDLSKSAPWYALSKAYRAEAKERECA